MAPPTAPALPDRLALLNPFGVARSRRDWIVDLIIFAVCVGLTPLGPLGTLAGSEAIWASLPHWWLVLEWIFGPVACLVLWWRRRYPVVVACVLAPLGGFLSAAGAPAVVSVYTVASRGRPRVAIGMTLAHLAIALPYFSLIPVLQSDRLFLTVNVVIVYIATLSIGWAVRSRRQVIEGLRESAARERREFAERLARVRAEERRQIAREMHDALAHRISLLSVHAGALEYRLPRDGAGGRTGLAPDELREGVAVIRRTAHQALEDLHQVLDLLKESEVAAELGRGAPQPRIDQVHGLLAEARGAGQTVRWTPEVEEDRLAALPEHTQRTIFRVLQEGLTNARKHTPGAVVTVSLRRDGDRLALMISNALPIGTTESEIPGAGTGLTGLTERVELIGGRLAHGAVEGDFVLRAELPWPPEPRAAPGDEESPEQDERDAHPEDDERPEGDEDE